MVNPTDTHTYDGKIDSNILPNLSNVACLPLDVKRERCNNFKILASSTFNHIALYHLDGIINSIGTDGNIDQTNNLIADDLLCLCWEYRNNSDFMIELELQLTDMSKGFCPQGRTHRLFQTLLAFS